MSLGPCQLGSLWTETEKSSVFRTQVQTVPWSPLSFLRPLQNHLELLFSGSQDAKPALPAGLSVHRQGGLPSCLLLTRSCSALFLDRGWGSGSLFNLPAGPRSLSLASESLLCGRTSASHASAASLRTSVPVRPSGSQPQAGAPIHSEPE